jgi:hypothetical protein
VTTTAAGKPALDSGGTWGPAASSTAGPAAAIAGSTATPPSRGYREEMEDFAFCVRQWDPKAGYEKSEGKYLQRLPRCHGKVAMADAIIALTANVAMKTRKRIEFNDLWFDEMKDDVPDKA